MTRSTQSLPQTERTGEEPTKGITAASLVELLQFRAQAQPNSLAFSFLRDGEVESESLTFAELDKRARAIAVSLQWLQSSKTQGERAVLLYPAGLEYICAFFGCLYANVIAVPVYPPRFNHNVSRLEAIIEDARPAIALTNAAVYQRMERHDWFNALGARFGQGSPDRRQLDWIVTDEIDSSDGDRWRDTGVAPDAIAFLQYTSGSTAAPKGVMVSHGNILHNQEMMRLGIGHHDRTVIVTWLPMYHDMGLVGTVLPAIYNGVPCHVMAPADFLKKPIRWLQAISRYRATFSGGPNFAYDLCASRISDEECGDLDLSCWDVAFNGAEPVRDETLKRFAKKFVSHGFRTHALYPCYGMAETTLFVSGKCLSQADANTAPWRLARAISGSGVEVELERTVVSCGTAWLEEQILIVDPQSRTPCPDEVVGEIWLASASIARGYWRQERETTEAFHARIADRPDDGPFFRTGDLGFRKNGELYITGRLRELIIIRGRNYYPHDIEHSVERSHPALVPGGAAAFSIDADGMERLVVVAELQRNQRREPDVEVIARATRKAIVSEHEVDLSSLVLIKPGNLPRTSSGKVQRGATRRRLAAGELSVVAQWHNGASGADTAAKDANEARIHETREWFVGEICARLKLNRDKVDVQESLAAHGGDSLALMEMAQAIEERTGQICSADSLIYTSLMEGEPSIETIVRRIAAMGLPQSLSASDSKSTTPQPPARRVEGSPLLDGHKSQTDGRNEQHRKPALESAQMATVETDLPRDHGFARYVNPHLARTLNQFAIDRVFVRGEGCYLYDEQGNRYLDFLAQYGALPFGYNHPRIWQALDNVRTHAEPSFTQPSFLNAAGELAERLVEISPAGLRYVTFANSGAEAVEAAIKLCRAATGRQGILAANNGFHGKTMGALSATDNKKYQADFGLPVPGFEYVPYGDVGALRARLREGSHAAFIVEPIQGEGGIIEPPAGFLAEAQEACRESGTLFVVDEIQTGLGRTGAMFACETEGVFPDVMLLAKALSGGLVPIGACLCTEQAYTKEFAMKHTSTYGGNTLACRAALASIDLLQENNQSLIRDVARNGARLKNELLRLKEKYPDVISEVRGRGYLLGLKFAIDKQSWGSSLLARLGDTEALTALIMSHLLNSQHIRVGYTLNDGGVLRIEPPLIATWRDCQEFVTALAIVLEKLQMRNTAHFTAHLSGVDPARIPAIEQLSDREPSPSNAKEPRRCNGNGHGRFAFVVHPLNLRSYVDVDSSFSVLSNGQIERIARCLADNFDPFVIGDTCIGSQTGAETYGEFIIVPRTAAELLSMPYRDALAEVRKATDLATERGARIIGLGAYTSVISRGGLSLKREGMPALTTGNTYTVVTGKQSVEAALSKQGIEIGKSTIAVIGATGSIGRATAMLLAQAVKKLILIGNPSRGRANRDHLLQLARRIVELLSRTEALGDAAEMTGPLARWIRERVGEDRGEMVDPDVADGLVSELLAQGDHLAISFESDSCLPACDVIVTATSSVEWLVHPRHLKRGAIVCDISRPSNVNPQVRESRPDVTVIDGGVVQMPRGARLGFDVGLKKGQAYACMAETMILALEGRYQDHGLGFDIDIGQLSELGHMAQKHGFSVVA